MRSVAVALAIAVHGIAAPATARAQPVITAAATATPSKKDQYLAAKHAHDKPALSRRAIGKPPPPVVSLYNGHTHEWLALDGDKRSALPPPVLVDRFLRCHYTNQPAEMDMHLARTLRDAADHFGKDRIEIVSGFRAPKYNLMLRKKGHQVARDSQHTHGDAVDFRIPGVDTRVLEAWARTLHMGGVGLYLESGFVHVDTGPVRYWNGT